MLTNVAFPPMLARVRHQKKPRWLRRLKRRLRPRLKRRLRRSEVKFIGTVLVLLTVAVLVTMQLIDKDTRSPQAEVSPLCVDEVTSNCQALERGVDY